LHVKMEEHVRILYQATWLLLLVIVKMDIRDLYVKLLILVYQVHVKITEFVSNLEV
jgi:hypothetical protein